MKRTIALLILLLLIPLTACQTKYKVEYFDEPRFFLNAKRAYAPGEEVLFYYTVDVTDAYFVFSVDGKEYPTTYENGKGYVFSFTMPDHDVKVTCKTVTIESLYDIHYKARNLEEVLSFPGKTIEELYLEDFETPIGLQIVVPIEYVDVPGELYPDENRVVQTAKLFINSKEISKQQLVKLLSSLVTEEYKEDENDPLEGQKKHFYTTFENENLLATIDETENETYYELTFQPIEKEVDEDIES